MPANLWNIINPTKRIDFYYKIDVIILVIKIGTKKASVECKKCQKLPYSF